VAVLVNKGLVKLARVAQDGMRVRASAGSASFRRRSTLELCLKQARAQVQALKGELDADPDASNRRRRAAGERAAEEREKRLTQALEQLAQVEKQKNQKPVAKKENETEEQHKKRSEPRASSTDAQARVMKMADGGFHPAYNVQFTTTTDSQIIVGVEVNNCGSDLGQLSPMLDQVQHRYEQCPAEWLADGGFARNADIEDAHRRGITVYAPVRHPRDSRWDNSNFLNIAPLRASA